MAKKLLITNIEPWASENPRSIKTAAIYVRVNGNTLKTFVPDMSAFKGKSIEEIKSFLVGKQVDAELNLLASDFNKKEPSPSKISNLNDNAEVELSGKVVDIKGPMINKDRQDIEEFFIDLDCGISIVNIKISKSKLNENNLKIGDYVGAKGRLDLSFKGEKNEN